MSSNWSTGTDTIKEVDTNKNLTLQMLKLRKQGGGTEYFVRKNDVKLGTKSVTQNGTYTAAADDKYGFSQFSVNVRGGNGSAGIDGKPTGTIPPGGSGSAVVGEDEDGNEAVIGVDENGQLVKTPLPSSIVLVTPPTKMDYNDGEVIDLSGAVVVAKMADGTTWTDVDHPNGHISCTPDPTTADIEAVTIRRVVDDDVTFAFTQDYAYSSSPDGVRYQRIEKYSGDGEVYYFSAVIPSDGMIFAYAASTQPFSVLIKQFNVPQEYDPGYHEHTGPAERYTDINGKNYYGVSTRYGNVNNGTVIHPLPATNVDYHGIGGPPVLFLNALEHGTIVGGGQEITLNWARPGDGKVLSTTMQIQVESDSSSEDEGGGGGHSF